MQRATHHGTGTPLPAPFAASLTSASSPACMKLAHRNADTEDIRNSCKPVCATGNFNLNLIESRGMARVCDRNNNPMEFYQGLRSQSGCSTASGTYLVRALLAPQAPYPSCPPLLSNTTHQCSDYAPTPVSSDLSYGFAIRVGGNPLGNHPDCCKCYELQWISGEADGKSMVVQVINIADESPQSGRNSDQGSSVRTGDLILLAPGGGVGPYNQGCSNQYGTAYNNRW